ncbi:MAG: GAG-binding domain-containing protein, partial [Aerococcaceae bacterium]|nr:GAG-binding domain-containing protein [Aerococcaceae bacterium]
MHKKYLSFKSFTYVTLLTLTITSTPTVLAETLGNEVEHMNAYSQELPTEISEPVENSEHVENTEEEMETVHFSQANKEEADERAKLTQKIEEGVQKALTTPGFVLVDGHNAYIELIQKAASVDEVDHHLAELKAKADNALAFQKKREEANNFIAKNYKYLGDRLADYNSFIEQQKTETDLEQIKAKAEEEHKKILIKLNEEAIERIKKTQEQINALPELDASHPDYSIQRQMWSYALTQIPDAISYTNTVKRQNSSAIQTHYEDSLLHWEIYANIELLSRKAAEYRKAFPTNEELSNKVRDMIYGEGTPYSTIEGAQEIPNDGSLRIFFKRDIVDKFKVIEALYNELVAAENNKQPEEQPQPDVNPQPETEQQPDVKPQPQPEAEAQPDVNPQ